MTTLLLVLAAFAAHAAILKQRNEFHPPAVVAVLPARETNEWNILVGKLRAAIRVTMVGWHSEVGYAKAALKAFLAD